jgi:type IV pilus assembly protein PilY1
VESHRSENRHHEERRAKIPFAWASLDPTQQIVLGDATTGPNVVNYIRGDQTNESATGYRRRIDSVLGDIVHSRPFYVGGANPRVYVAANDGMLHAFDATTGDEVFAYIPSMVIPKLVKLTVDDDPFIHRYYVDGSPNVGKTRQQTILVGGLGAGARASMRSTSPIRQQVPNRLPRTRSFGKSPTCRSTITPAITPTRSSATRMGSR